MKRIMTFLCIVLFWSTVKAQDNFFMSGKFSDVKNDTLVVEFIKREPMKEIINFKVDVNDKGEFHFGCQIKNAYDASLALETNKRQNFIFFVPDEKVVIDGAFAQPHDWLISGSAFYQNLAKVKEVRNPFLKEFEKSETTYEQKRKEGGDEKILKEQRAKTNIDINKRMTMRWQNWAIMLLRSMIIIFVRS